MLKCNFDCFISFHVYWVHIIICLLKKFDPSGVRFQVIFFKTSWRFFESVDFQEINKDISYLSTLVIQLKQLMKQLLRPCHTRQQLQLFFISFEHATYQYFQLWCIVKLKELTLFMTYSFGILFMLPSASKNESQWFQHKGDPIRPFIAQLL